MLRHSDEFKYEPDVELTATRMRGLASCCNSHCKNKNWPFTCKADIVGKKLVELRAICKECGILKGGNKNKVAARLWAHGISDQSETFEIEELESESDDEI